MKDVIKTGCVLALLAAGASAGLVVEQWGGDGLYAHPKTLTVAADGKKIRVDLSALPAGGKVRRARLVCFREPPAADSDEALVDAEVQAGKVPLKLIAPWYDAFAVPPSAVIAGEGLTLSVKALPGWIAQKTFLEIAYDAPEAGPDSPAVNSAHAVHDAGQTFVTWEELDKLIHKDRPTWLDMTGALERLDADKRVRYRVYASDRPITPARLDAATLLGEVKPLSGYNVLARSPDQAFVIMRKRMLEDLDYAKTVSGRHYGIPTDAYNAVVIDRFVIPGGRKPLPNGTGLFVHHPTRAGKGYYAVTAVVNGREGTARFATAGPVDEKPGTGRAVFQREMDLKVLFDYAGKRLQYVQWTAPPLSSLPNRHCNWSVFIPDGVKRPAPLELVLTGNGMFRRPRWPHRPDTVLVSPQDAPDSCYYGYHESRGTLRSMRQGLIQPYTWRRMLTFLQWAVDALKIDASRMTCTGDRGISSTAALHFGMRHPEVFSLVFTCKGMPNPAALPAMKKLASWHPRPSRTGVWQLQRIFGQKDWGLKTAVNGGGPTNVWEFLDLPREVTAHPKVLRPMLSYGGRGGWDWQPVGAFLKALAEARQPVISEGTWGAVNPPGVKNPGRGSPGLDVRRGRPIPVFTAHSGDYQGGRNGGGGQTNYGVWWLDAGIVDEPAKFEIVITGRGTVSITPRRMKKFVVAPGEKVRYEVKPIGTYRGRVLKTVSGEATADRHGLVTVEKILVPGKAKLTLTRSGS